jgi:hypothetical protein
VKKLLLLLLLSISGICFGQKKNDSENKLIQLEKTINSYLLDRNILDIDSLNTIKKRLILDLLKSSSLTTDFSTLEDERVFNIISSKDKKLRIICWDSETGGTMHFFESICQFQGIGKVEITELNAGDNNYRFYYDRIEQVDLKRKRYYLPIGMGRYSNQDFSCSIENLTIDRNSLHSENKIFKTKTQKLNQIIIEYKWFENIDIEDKDKEFIKYIPEKKLLKIAIIDENGKFLKRHLTYKLKEDGFYYEKQ